MLRKNRSDIAVVANNNEFVRRPFAGPQPIVETSEAVIAVALGFDRGVEFTPGQKQMIEHQVDLQMREDDGREDDGCVDDFRGLILSKRDGWTK